MRNTIQINIAKQQLLLFSGDNPQLQTGNLLHTFSISSAKNGAGQKIGSEQTPLGLHQIYAKIGQNCQMNTIFVGRRATGEIYSESLFERYPGRDWILTRILWLNGLEYGKNRCGENDTWQRYIYIHGAPDRTPLGVPGSRGCIRMANADLIQLFDKVGVGSKVLIEG